MQHVRFFHYFFSIFLEKVVHSFPFSFSYFLLHISLKFFFRFLFCVLCRDEPIPSISTFIDRNTLVEDGGSGVGGGVGDGNRNERKVATNEPKEANARRKKRNKLKETKTEWTGKREVEGENEKQRKKEKKWWAQNLPLHFVMHLLYISFGRNIYNRLLPSTFHNFFCGVLAHRRLMRFTLYTYTPVWSQTMKNAFPHRHGTYI